MSYTCKKCKKSFKQERYLKQHQNRINPCLSEYRCQKCNKKFQSASLLKRHEGRITPCAPASIPVITGDNEENKCHLCGNTYASTSNLKRHKKTCKMTSSPD